MPPNARLLSEAAASAALHTAGEFLIENPTRYNFVQNRIPMNTADEGCLMGWALFFVLGYVAPSNTAGYVLDHESIELFGFDWDTLLDQYEKYSGLYCQHDDVQTAPNILQWGAQNINKLRNAQ